MTLIIGIRCKDGIVIGSDRKVLRGGEVEYSNKVYEMNNIAYAVEGLTGIADDFNYLLNLEIKKRRGVDTLYELKVIAEDIIWELTARYTERISQPAGVSPIGILMGGLENINSGKASLYYIHGEGYGEATKFICSGHGGPYATTLAKFLLKEELSCEENAKRVAFVIAYVAEDIDTTVGGDPMVAIIKDSDTYVERPIMYLKEEIVKEMVRKAKEVKENLDQRLGFQ